MQHTGRCSLEILSLETGEREKCFDFKDNFGQNVEESLAYNDSWLAIPFQQKIMILDNQKSQIKYLERPKGINNNPD